MSTVATVAPAPATSRFKLLYLLVSLGIAAVLLLVSVRGIDWTRVWQIVRNADGARTGLVVLIFSVALFLRAFRWRVLLLAEAKVRLSAAFHATSAGYLFNNILPARAGELVRTVMVSRSSKVSRMFVLTTALLERVADAIALVTISGIVLALFTSGPDWLSKAAAPVAGMGLAALAGMAVLPRTGNLLFSVIDRLPTRLTRGLRLQHLLQQVLNGIGSFHDMGRLTRFVLLTGVIWLLDATSAVVCARSIGLEMSFPLAMLLIAGLGLGSALPSTPGYVGIFQFVAVSILTPAGFSRSEAIAYILFWQAVSYVVYGAWGVIALVRERAPRES